MAAKSSFLDVCWELLAGRPVGFENYCRKISIFVSFSPMNVYWVRRLFAGKDFLDIIRSVFSSDLCCCFLPDHLSSGHQG